MDKLQKLAYLAGFFDGEGCIYIGFQRRRHCLYMSVVNTKLDSLQLFQEEFGGGIYLTKKATEKHQTIYAWMVSHNRAASSMRTLLPWLVLKKAEAELGLEFQALITSVKHHRYNPISDAEIAQREVYRLRLAAMKGRASRISIAKRANSVNPETGTPSQAEAIIASGVCRD